jgi:hypothetical protein
MNAHLRAVLAASLAAAVLAVSAPAVRAGAEEDVKEFEDYLKTKPESQALRNRIADFCLRPDKAKVKVLMSVLRNPSYDDDVKVTVCQNIGKMGEPSVAGALMHIFDAKENEDKTKLRAAALEGAGDANAKGLFKELIKIGKKYVGTNGDLASAAYRAASVHVTRDCLEEVMKGLETVTPGSMDAKAASKRPHFDAVRPVLISILKKMTGLDYGEPEAWKRWWDENEKTWTPPDPNAKEADLNASMEFKDVALGFQISRPNKRWLFRKGSGTTHVLTIEVLEEGQRAAWVEIYAQQSKNMKSQNAEALAKEVRDGLETKFRDFKEANWEKPCQYGGVRGVEQILVGRHKDLDAIHVHNVFLYENNFAYRIECTYKSGKQASFQNDLEEVIRSWKPVK